MGEDPKVNNPAVQEFSPFYGWKMSKKDLVMYKDQQSRGLEFLFSLSREKDSPFVSPLNKNVSVYQKPDSEGHGDFVIVSLSGNNPNDIRIFEITNEEYGEIGAESDPMSFIKRVIEMADNTGMTRDIKEYGDYVGSGTKMHTEFAGALFDSFKGFAAKFGVGSAQAAQKTTSVINSAGPAAQQAGLSFTQQVAYGGTQALGRMTVAGANTIMSTTATSSARNADATQIPKAGIGGFFSGIGTAQKMNMQMKMQQMRTDQSLKVAAAKQLMGTEQKKEMFGVTKDPEVLKKQAYATEFGRQQARSEFAPVQLGAQKEARVSEFKEKQAIKTAPPTVESVAFHTAKGKKLGTVAGETSALTSQVSSMNKNNRGAAGFSNPYASGGVEPMGATAATFKTTVGGGKFKVDSPKTPDFTVQQPSAGFKKPKAGPTASMGYKAPKSTF